MVNLNDIQEDLISKIPEYANAINVDNQIFYERPFIETTALIGETISLEYEIADQTGIIRIREMPGKRKDRYTCASYGNYFASLLERDLLNEGGDYEFVTFYN